MVTAGRRRLAERAVQCFCNQTWANKELVIVDDGGDDYSAMLEPYRTRASIRYERIDSRTKLVLGELRNVSLDRAQGDYCAQWDDDEWYHPQRIEAQMSALAHGGAAVLRYTLMHLDGPVFVDHPYRTGLHRGTPGTVVHRRSTARYPNQPRREDSAYLRTIRREQPVAIMGADWSHLFIRCYHGQNTWDHRHFIERLWYSPRDKAEYLRAKYLRRCLWSHRAFDLTALERASVAAFLAQNRDLGLHTSEPFRA
jgi:glycosyltransferase involved in cell wall biosynthesis